jgi:hypothetical protein
MKEPEKIPLNPETPKSKDVPKQPLTPVYKPQWDIMPDNDSVYTKKDLENIGSNKDENSENSD